MLSTKNGSYCCGNPAGTMKSAAFCVNAIQVLRNIPLSPGEPSQQHPKVQELSSVQERELNVPEHAGCDAAGSHPFCRMQHPFSCAAAFGEESEKKMTTAKTMPRSTVTLQSPFFTFSSPKYASVFDLCSLR